MSHVTCHVPHVTCHVSHVTCQEICFLHFNILFLFYFFSSSSFFYVKKIRQSGGASRWRVCYQRGLPRLVFFNPHQQISSCNHNYSRAGQPLPVWRIWKPKGSVPKISKQGTVPGNFIFLLHPLSYNVRSNRIGTPNKKQECYRSGDNIFDKYCAILHIFFQNTINSFVF